jgi:hypothetical protein
MKLNIENIKVAIVSSLKIDEIPGIVNNGILGIYKTIVKRITMKYSNLILINMRIKV